MTGPEQHANTRALKARLYAALKHEKSCACGECSGGLNAVDDLAFLAERADTLERERDKLRRLADERLTAWRQEVKGWREGEEQARAEADRLREALRTLYDVHYPNLDDHERNVARAALAGPQTKEQTA